MRHELHITGNFCLMLRWILLIIRERAPFLCAGAEKALIILWFPRASSWHTNACVEKAFFPSRINSAVECSGGAAACFFQAPELIRLFRMYNIVLKALQITTHCERGPWTHIRLDATIATPRRGFSTSCFLIPGMREHELYIRHSGNLKWSQPGSMTLIDNWCMGTCY